MTDMAWQFGNKDTKKLIISKIAVIIIISHEETTDILLDCQIYITYQRSV